ncbi:MAG: gephyrin-like molybdotransferase Glp, partial [Thermoproteota archaeon]|nr:gephyrin-like molybdotransferase Glp [Thermoproteota archaeon]
MFRRLVSLEEAKKILQRNFPAKPVGIEEVSLPEAHGRVLAEDIAAPINVPSFSRSTVDGYAVKSEDTFGAEEDNPTPLKLLGSVQMGKHPSIIVEKGGAVEIATGAPLPEGADAVVMLEHVVKDGSNLLVYRSVVKEENVMKGGFDIRKGETVLKKAWVLRACEIGVLAALGITRVKVFKPPKVAVFSTGPEIVKPGKPLPPGKIYDINAYSLSVAVSECGGTPVNLGIVPDNTEQLKTKLRNALDSADAVVTSGGVSVGSKDVMPKVLNTLGNSRIIVCGIAVKPGKPTTFAVVDGKPVFSLPGNPTSSLLIFHILVRPIISRMAGRATMLARKVMAVITTRIFSARGRRTFIMVSLDRDKAGRLLASPVPTGLS